MPQCWFCALINSTAPWFLAQLEIVPGTPLKEIDSQGNHPGIRKPKSDPLHGTLGGEVEAEGKMVALYHPRIPLWMGPIQCPAKLALGLAEQWKASTV